MTVILDERGDLTAKPGSKPWAVAVRIELQYLSRKSTVAEEQMNPYLEKLEETEAYRQLTDKNDNPFKSAIEFYEYPKPFGLGNPGKLKDYIGKLRGRKGRPKKGEKGYNCNIKDRGNRIEYILAKLENDHPDILEDYQLGKYRSARQAGIAAGFIKDIKRIQVLPEPKKIAAKLIERLTEEQINEVIELLLTQKPQM